MKRFNPPGEQHEAQCKNRAVLQARSLHVAAPSNGPVLLDDVSLLLEPGRIMAVAGPNGSGKSTLVRTLSRVLPPRRGDALLDDRDLYAELTVQAAARAIAVVPQETNVAFDFTAQDVVAMGRTPHQGARGMFGMETADDRAAVARAMDLAALDRHLRGRTVQSLSGGERQRVLIARALAQDADVLLLDEPTAALDLQHQTALLETLRGLAREEGRTILVVLHDLNLASEYADTIVLLKAGRIIAQGTPRDVVTNANVQAVYGAHVWVRRHPVSGRPYVLSLPDLPVGHESAALAGMRVHLLCGGGTGAPIMTRLALAGAHVTAGPLNEGDTDDEIAGIWKVVHRRIPSFTSVPPLDASEAEQLLREGALCLLTHIPVGDGNLETLRAALTLAARGARVLVLHADDKDFSSRDFTTGSVAATLWTQLLAFPHVRVVLEEKLWASLLDAKRPGSDASGKTEESF